MKYTRIQRIIKRVCDENVNDPETIKLILNTICQKSFFCSFVIERNYNVFYCAKARILSVDDEIFTYRSFIKKATMKDSAKIGELRELKVETEIEKIVDKAGEKDDRWLVLDLEEVDAG